MKQRLCLLGIVGGVALLALVPPAQSGTPSCFGKAATIVGTDGNDVLTGTSGNDVIVGLGGSDGVHAGDGDDLVCGNGGNDILQGEGDNDKLSLGPRGMDEVSTDQTAGGQLDSGNDLMIGADGSDDGLQGGPGDDVLKGLTGHDTLQGHAGKDKLYGGGGPDGIDAVDGEADFVNGGGDTDNCFFDPGLDTVKKCP